MLKKSLAETVLRVNERQEKVRLEEICSICYIIFFLNRAIGG